MLILLNKYNYPGRPELGVSPLINNIVVPLREAGLPVRDLYLDELQGQEAFERRFHAELRDEDLVWIVDVMTPWITRSLLAGLRRSGVRIVAVFHDAIRLMAPLKTYRFWEKHYWYHDKIHRAFRVARHADVIVHFDWPESHHPEKTILFPAPQPAKLYHPGPDHAKRHDVSFVGPTRKGQRRR